MTRHTRPSYFHTIITYATEYIQTAAAADAI